ncbi:hypothetical protein [Burkholderia gladioli]|uniref:hypothetical protein n=1 Tax=Burkholderia gladioli TaxID=28095 RepID=UPI000F53C878|nr:hypothetical protein [Burkholderia gladioli]
MQFQTRHGQLEISANNPKRKSLPAADQSSLTGQDKSHQSLLITFKSFVNPSIDKSNPGIARSSDESARPAPAKAADKPKAAAHHALPFPLNPPDNFINGRFRPD